MTVTDRKNCSICVYDGVCEGRRHDLTIKDCCIPVARLRQLQKVARTVDDYAMVTMRYISKCKAESEYWKKHIVIEQGDGYR